MAVYFWYLIKRDLSSVRYSTEAYFFTIYTQHGYVYLVHPVETNFVQDWIKNLAHLYFLLYCVRRGIGWIWETKNTSRIYEYSFCGFSPAWNFLIQFTYLWRTSGTVSEIGFAPKFRKRFCQFRENSLSKLTEISRNLKIREQLKVTKVAIFTLNFEKFGKCRYTKNSDFSPIFREMLLSETDRNFTKIYRSSPKYTEISCFGANPNQK